MTIKSAARWMAGAIIASGVVTAGVAQLRFGGYPYQSGKELYEHICQGCHMPDAKGAQGAGMYPALAGDRKLQSPLYPVLVIVKGQKAMPSFSDLTDAQVAEVTNYVRSNFGNSFPGSVTADQVKALRPKPKAAGTFSAG